MNLFEKLLEARMRFHTTTNIKKSGYNAFGKYHYFELGDFVVPILQIFKELGILSIVSFTKENATMTLVDVDKPEDRIEFNSPMGGAELKATHEIQQIGAVETYQRRYLYVMALDIVEHDAIDNQPPPKPKSTAKETFEKLPSDVQGYLRTMAMDVTALLHKDDVAGAFDYIEEQDLDADSKTGLWGLLDSKQRSTLKKESESRKKKGDV